MADNTNNPEIIAKIKFDTSDAPETIGNLRQEFTKAKQEIYETTKGTEEYFQALKRAAAVKAEMTELNRVIKLLNPEEKIKAIQGLAEGAVGAFAAVRGASALFGSKNEEVLKTLEKLEGAMALLRGLKAFNEGIRDAKALAGVLGLASKAAKVHAAATKEIGVAQEGAAEGTKVATTATKGFGVALKGIGIGLIVSALAYLITNFDDIKKTVLELFPGLGKLGEVFDKVKAIVFGVGGAIIKAIITPFKVVMKLIHGDFSGALDELKDGLNVVKNFSEAQANEAAKIAEQHRKDELQKEVEHTDKLIEIMDARGQDTYKIEAQNWKDKISLAEKGTKEYDDLIQQQAVFEAKHLKDQDEENKKANEKAEEARKKHLEKLKELEKQYAEFVGKTDKEIEEQKALSGGESQAVLKYKKDLVDIEATQKEEQKELKKFLDQKFITQAQYNAKLAELDQAAALKRANAEAIKQKDILKEAQESATKEVDIVKHGQVEQEAIISEQYAKGIITKEQYQKKLFDVNTLYLNKERETLLKYGQDTANIDKLIAENDIKLKEETEKTKAEIIAKANKKTVDDFKAISTANLLNVKQSFKERLKIEDNAYKTALLNTNLTEEERTQLEKEHSDTRKKIAQLEADAKKADFKAAEGLLNNAGEALGKNTAAGKAAAIAATTISTYQAAQAAFASQLVPGDPTSPGRGFIAAASSIVAGLARVKAIIATKTPGGGVGSQSNPVFTAPVSGDFSPPSISSVTPTTTLSQDSINQISSATQQNQSSQVTVSESDITSTQIRVSQYSTAGQI
jgi:hypothetical protein